MPALAGIGNTQLTKIRALTGIYMIRALIIEIVPSGPLWIGPDWSDDDRLWLFMGRVV